MIFRHLFYLLDSNFLTFRAVTSFVCISFRFIRHIFMKLTLIFFCLIFVFFLKIYSYCSLRIFFRKSQILSKISSRFSFRGWWWWRWDPFWKRDLFWFEKRLQMKLENLINETKRDRKWNNRVFEPGILIRWVIRSNSYQISDDIQWW